MDPQQIQIFAGLFVAVLLIGWLGHFLIMRGLRVIFFTLFGLAFALGAFFMVQAQGAQGWDALGWFIGFLFLAAPVLVGLGAGGLIAWVRLRRRG